MVEFTESIGSNYIDGLLKINSFCTKILRNKFFTMENSGKDLVKDLIIFIGFITTSYIFGYIAHRLQVLHLVYLPQIAACRIDRVRL